MVRQAHHDSLCQRVFLDLVRSVHIVDHAHSR